MGQIPKILVPYVPLVLYIARKESSCFKIIGTVSLIPNSVPYFVHRIPCPFNEHIEWLALTYPDSYHLKEYKSGDVIGVNAHTIVDAPSNLLRLREPANCIKEYLALQQ